MAAGVLVAVAAVSVAGCSSPGTASAAGVTTAGKTATGAAYWTRATLLAAQAWPETTGPQTSASSSAHTSQEAPRVGALFLRAGHGNHYCTASVVSSPGRDLLVTAAHCINGGDGGGYRSDVVFIPGYRDGRAPHGIWTPARQPITCKNWTIRQSASQLKFSCDGFTVGTSGSPWVTGFDPATRTGRVVGVIGGYQRGGDTAAVSYSAYFGTAISRLYHEAISR